MTDLVNNFNNPSGPVNARPRTLASATIAAAAACSGDSCRPPVLFFAELTRPDDITQSAHPARPQPGVVGPKHRS